MLCTNEKSKQLHYTQRELAATNWSISPIIGYPPSPPTSETLHISLILGYPCAKCYVSQHPYIEEDGEVEGGGEATCTDLENQHWVSLTFHRHIRFPIRAPIAIGVGARGVGAKAPQLLWFQLQYLCSYAVCINIITTELTPPPPSPPLPISRMFLHL